MEKPELTWQLLSVMGGFMGVIGAMVRWYGSRIHDLLDKLVLTVNEHTTVIRIEQKRNDDQDEKLDKHAEDIEEIKEVIYQVKYRKA